MPHLRCSLTKYITKNYKNNSPGQNHMPYQRKQKETEGLFCKSDSSDSHMPVVSGAQQDTKNVSQRNRR